MENIQTLLESKKYTSLSASDSASMKMMLENTEKEHARLISEGTLSGDVASFTPILMPMVRRVYPNLIANELLGVQPMTMPTGFIYALTNQYTGSQNLGTSSTNHGQVIQTSVALSVGDVITTAGGASGTVVHVEGLSSLVVLAGTVAVSGFVAANTIVEAVGGGALGTTTVDATFSNEAAFGRILSNYSGSMLTGAAEALGTDMAEVGFSISKKSVEARSRALKGQYSVEMYQDLKAQHGLLADEEIMSLMSYEMQAEIDREVVDFVNANATQLADTTFSVGVDAATAAIAAQSGRWELEKYRTEAIRISIEAQQIGLDTKRGQGNVLIVSPKVVTMLEQLGSFKTATVENGISVPTAGGIAGTFDNKFKVIVDQYATSDYATVLYKGADRRDAMGFFAPYVPMSFTKVTHQDSGQPAVIAKTRYALDTIPGISSPTSNDRANTYARTFGVNFANTVFA